MALKNKFKTAHKMFEEVVPLVTQGSPDEQLAYRGHGDAQYDLVPSFMRHDGHLNLLDYESNAIAITKASAPYRMFYQTANELGYALPSISAEKHRNYTSTSGVEALLNFTNEAEAEYDSDEFEIMAFAQHYGLPTPLLDWSRSPLVAMYFAASDALKKIVKYAYGDATFSDPQKAETPKVGRAEITAWLEESFVSVWRADINAISEMVRNRETFKKEQASKYKIRFFTPRTQGNSNIVAQQGLFSIHYPVPMSFDYRHGEGERTCLSVTVAEYVEWHMAQDHNSPYIKEALQKGVLHEFLLPYSEVPALMTLLHRCGIHAASIYPGHTGCAERVRERGALAFASSLRQSKAV